MIGGANLRPVGFLLGDCSPALDWTQAVMECIDLDLLEVDVAVKEIIIEGEK